MAYLGTLLFFLVITMAFWLLIFLAMFIPYWITLQVIDTFNPELGERLFGDKKA
jgi:protein-S-isoprenylcysteine O-methyltransferase Ste14